jgi:TorA maturation chaperone TorD
VNRGRSITWQLRRLYREVGIDLAPGAGELPDHVAVELEALAYALTPVGSDRVAGTLLAEHLSQWLPRLCRAVAGEARHPFYASLGEVTPDWLSYIQGDAAPAG